MGVSHVNKCMVEGVENILPSMTYIITKHIEGVIMPLSSNNDDERDYKKLLLS